MSLKAIQKYFLLLILTCLFCFSANAQDYSVPDSLPNNVVVGTITYQGNKVTKNHIIAREIIIHSNDSLRKEVFIAALERSRENLINTFLFNFVSVKCNTVSGKTNVTFKFAERWYFWPAPVFEVVDRNFNAWLENGAQLARTNYGLSFDQENFRGRKEKLSIDIRLGFSEQLSFAYDIPYINKGQKSGLNFRFSYARQKEIPYGIEDSKLQFFKNDEEFVRKSVSANIRYTYRKGIYHTTNLWTQYRNNTITDTVLYFNPDFFFNKETQQELIVVGFRHRVDKRDNRAYPLEGKFFEVQVVKQGLGILKNEPDLLHLISTYRQYVKLSRLWFYHASVKGKLSGYNDAPYFNQRALGYSNDLVRGYEFYVVNGQSFALFKSNLKFNLFPEKIFYLKWLPVKKFNSIPHAVYLNFNYDMGYASEENFQELNPLGNTLLLGGGLGLDVVSYYNFVMRMEYSFNKFGENGFFIHFRAPI